MSVHNVKRFVREATESIFAQTYRDFEFLTVDDGSTDGSLEILAEAAKKDARLKIITNETNLGLTRSLNKALQQAQGVYIARMDADDVALPERLEKQLAFLETHPDITMVGTAYEWIDEQNVVIGKKKVLSDPNALHKILIRTNPFLHGSIMIRKEVLDRAGGYDERYKKAQDYELWLRLSSACLFANLPDILMQKRMTKQMISFKSECEQIRYAVRARMGAIKRGNYPLWCIVFLSKPFLATILPMKIVRWARVHLFGQKIYSHSSLR
jgi:glycosyltransferase involved in cell wall biosynthesis